MNQRISKQFSRFKCVSFQNYNSYSDEAIMINYMINICFLWPSFHSRSFFLVKMLTKNIEKIYHATRITS
jgi:hypothetical protein